MEREDIEQAATDYSGSWASTPIHLNDIYRRDDFEAGFVTGAEWRIESVWHTMDVEPDKELQLVLYGDDRIIMINWNGDMKWKGMDKFFKAEKWAYINDLIPEKL